MPKIKLTIEEANMLDHLTHDTKMDCWFWIDGNLRVRDLENGKRFMSISEAVLLIDDGITDINDYSLSEQEKNCYRQLIYRIKATERL